MFGSTSVNPAIRMKLIGRIPNRPADEGDELQGFRFDSTTQDNFKHQTSNTKLVSAGPQRRNCHNCYLVSMADP